MARDQDECPKGGTHEYKEVSSPTDMEGETYECQKCGDRYRLYYEDMA